MSILNNMVSNYGGMLTGTEIEKQIEKGNIKIDPYDRTRLNPNSYNLRLGNTLKIYTNKILDSHKKNLFKEIIIPKDGFVLMPNTLYIGNTMERTFTDLFIPMINGRSSGGRLGLSVHICAGFGDIGFDGNWTLEITAVHPLKIYPGDEMAQICFFTPYGSTEYLYNGRYQGQKDPTISKFFASKREKSIIKTHSPIGLNYDDRMNIAVILKMKYGEDEFIKNEIDLKTAHITTDLYPDECMNNDDTFSVKDDLDRIAGKVYKVGGRDYYVRCK